jgi:FMN-dependent NADH-azoreductase
VKVLHVIASPRGAFSSTLRVSETFLDSLRAQRGDVEVDVVDLFNADLPGLAGDNIEAKYTLMMGQPIDRNHAQSWQQIERLIEHFLSADAYVFSVPMWNFSIPYALKYYIDCIVQPGYLFRLSDMGIPLPLVHGRKMLCITARGSDYSAGSPTHALDFQEPYLRTIFGFVGITDMTFVNINAVDIPGQREAVLASAQAAAIAIAGSPGWARPPTLAVVSDGHG